MGLSPSTLRSESLQCLVTDPDYLMHSVDQHRVQVTPIPDNSQTKFCDTHLTVSPVPGDVDERLWLCPASLLDCRLRLVCKGHLELRTSDLVFRYASYVFTWPLGSLRWYAEDAKHFVFESGRHCPSGPGLFVFKCKQSKKLSFKLGTQIHHLLSYTSYPNRHGSMRSVPRCYTARSTLGDGKAVTLLFHTEHSTEVNGDQSATTNSVSAIPPRPPTVTLGEDTNDYPSLFQEDTHPLPNPVLENNLSVCYPLLVMSSPRSVSTTQRSMVGTYLDWLNPATASPTPTEVQSSSYGQYLIAAAPHPYVNQPNRMLPALVPPSVSDTSRPGNEYVVQPTPLSASENRTADSEIPE